MMEAVAQSLRRQGVEKVDNEDVSGVVLQRHIAVKHGSEKNAGVFVITGSSSDPDLSRKIVSTHYETWRDMIPKLAPTVKQRYLESARSELSDSDFQEFESNWRTAEERGELSATPVRTSRKWPTMRNWVQILGDPCPEYWPVTTTYPYWNPCLAIAGLWLGLGIIAFGINLWRRCRAYRSANETSLSWPKC